MSNKSIIITSAILLLNPVNLYVIGDFLLGSELVDIRMAFPGANMKETLAEGSFLEVLKMNVLFGYQSTLIWSWNAGRIFTIPGLFFLGVYFAKSKSFTDRPLQFWYSLLIASLITWLCFDLLYDAWAIKIDEKPSRKLFTSIMDTYIKLAVTFSILSTFIIVWRHNDGDVFIAKFANFGRMGLTNYLLMSLIGSMLYYGWGFSLYKYCGSTITLLIGIFVLMLQMKFSSYWLARYKQGPLESLWRKASWVGSSR
jgi:uncharacterized protein